MTQESAAAIAGQFLAGALESLADVLPFSSHFTQARKF
jgi:hypothetical protein